MITLNLTRGKDLEGIYIMLGLMQSARILPRQES